MPDSPHASSGNVLTREIRPTGVDARSDRAPLQPGKVDLAIAGQAVGQAAVADARDEVLMDESCLLYTSRCV